MTHLGEAGKRVRSGLAKSLLDLVDSEGVVKASAAGKKLGLPKNLVLEVARELSNKDLIDVESHLLRDTELIKRLTSRRKIRDGDHATRIIAVSNQKGGVGKTVTSVNLSAALAEIGRPTLLVDLDSQANTTSGLGFDKHSIKKSVYDCLINYTPISDIIMPTSFDKLDLLPANVDLAGVEVELVNLPARETRLKRILADVNGAYEYVIIDCPPSLGMLTLNGLVAADSVIIPVQCDYYALEGMSQLVGTIELVRQRLNSKISLEGIVLTMYDPRTKLSTQIAENVRAYFKDRVYNTLIPRNVKLSEAASFGKSILDYDRSSTGARAYIKLAEEVSEDGG